MKIGYEDFWGVLEEGNRLVTLCKIMVIEEDEALEKLLFFASKEKS